jgi:hypothetical protein
MNRCYRRRCALPVPLLPVRRLLCPSLRHHHPTPCAASCCRACSCAPPAAPPLLLFLPQHSSCAPDLPCTVIRVSRTAANSCCSSLPPPAAVLPSLRNQQGGTAPYLAPCAPAEPAGHRNRGQSSHPGNYEQTRRCRFLREIRSLRCISAAGKAWNRIPSLSSFFSPTSREIPCPKSSAIWRTVAAATIGAVL